MLHALSTNLAPVASAVIGCPEQLCEIGGGAGLGLPGRARQAGFDPSNAHHFPPDETTAEGDYPISGRVNDVVRIQ